MSDTHHQPQPQSAVEAANEQTVKIEALDLRPDEAVGQSFGRYKLLEKLGEGGFGAVWLAEQKEPVRRKVALKIIKLGMDTKAVVARFEAERQALAMMDHPNIAKVLDAGTTEQGRPYFVMELVRGTRITSYCDEAQLATPDRIDLFIKVCHAIQHAHQKGVIHRDIKPSNILVTLHDGVPVPKVIDFGIAKATQGDLTDKTIHTQFHQFVGTPAYISPEQAEMSGLDIDTRSDIYSLGVLLYELLVGRTPFNATELVASGLDAMRKTIREKEPDRPSSKLSTLGADELTTEAKRRSSDSAKLLHQLRGDLDWIVMKCLEKDRARRYDTANGLAMDLKRHLNNEPVVARPPSAAYKFQKAWRRNKLVFTAGMAVAAALVAGIGVSTWQYFGKSAAEREQHRLRQEAEAKALEAREAQAQAAQQRDLARERLYDSLVREVRTIRKARQVGYRTEAFDRLKQAIALGTTNIDRSALRREAAACLGDWLGLDPVDFPHDGDPWSDALTADGSLAAIASRNKRVSLRDTSSGREVAAFTLRGMPLSLAFDAKGLSLYISLVDQDYKWGRRPGASHLEKWSLRGNGSWTHEWSRANQGFQLVAPTAEGPVALLVGPSDTYFAVVEIEPERELARVPVNSKLSWFPIAAISADRRQFAFFGLEGESSFEAQLEVWELASSKRLTLLKPQLGSAFGLAFAPDGRSLAATYDNMMVAYDTSGFNALVSRGGSFEGSYGATLGGKAGLLAVPSIQEYAVRLIQVRSGTEIACLKLPATPVSVTFSQDGSVLLLTHRTGCRVIRFNSNNEKLRLEGHLGGVPAVEFSPDGAQLASAGKDRTLRLWNLAQPGEFSVLSKLPAPGQTLAFTPDGTFLACAYYNTSDLSIWSLSSKSQVRAIERSKEHEGTTWSCAISTDGKYLAAVGTGLRLWNLPPLLRLGPVDVKQSLIFSETNGVAGVVFDPANSRLAFTDRVNAAGTVMGLYLQDLAAGSQPSLITTNAQLNYVQTLCFLPKRGELVYVTQEREIVLMNVETRRMTHTIPTVDPGETGRWYVGNVRASPDESKIAMVTYSGLGVDIRELPTGKILYTLPEEPGSIWWLAWSPDSRQLAVTRSHGEIAIWNLNEVEHQLAQLGLSP